MRRILLVLIAATVLGVLLVPATASATTWPVKNGSGVTIGKVTKLSTHKSVLYDKKGKRCGSVEWNDDLIGYIATLAYSTDTGVRKQALVPFGNAFNGWFIASLDNNEPIGGCEKANGKWVVMRERNNAVVGRVSASCPQWAAAGAVYALNTSWKWPY
jgi:hypothetical protein